jgi:allantoinase
VKFFATVREAVGTRSAEIEADDIKSLLEKLKASYGKRFIETVIDEETDKLKRFYQCMVNGKRIELLDGYEASLVHGCQGVGFDMVDLVVKNAKLLLESGLTRGGLAIDAGRICSIATDEHLPDASTVIDALGKIVIPGLIDGHVHLHDPAMLSHEDFTTGSRAAAAGGVTTVIDMPLTNQVDSPKAVEEKIAQGESMSVVDFSFYAGMLNSNNYTMIPAMVEKGIAAFKAFTCEPYPASDGVLIQALSAASESGGHVTLHAENQGVLDEFGQEMDGDKQAVTIAEQTGGHLHVAHITTREGLAEVERGKLRGTMVTTEVCPHHLVFHRDEMNRLGPKSKMNPPLRSRTDRSALWSGLLRGTIDMTVSDHAPCPPEMKEAGTDDIREAWSGVDGVQMILRVLLSEGINKGRVSFTRLLNVASLNPAKLFGLYPRKGVLAIGADADFVIIDPTREEKLTSEMMFSKCGWTLYEGMKMKGAPIMTIVRGTPIYEEGRILVEPGYGEFQAMQGISPFED